MSCAAIMTRNPPTIRDSETVAAAADMLIAQRATNLPVIDAEGKYVGMFGMADLLSLLVPRMALAGDLAPNLRFLSDETAALRRKFDDVKARRVGDAANRQAVTLYPDTPASEAIRCFGRAPAALPIVARDTGKLAGVVTYWDAIAAATGAVPAR